MHRMRLLKPPGRSPPTFTVPCRAAFGLRVVVVAGGVEHVGHRLFLQWLRSDAKTQSYELVRTVNVTELNLAQGYLLEVLFW